MNTDMDFTILIVGNNSFNNSILLDLLKKETGLPCRASENLDELKTLIEIENNNESTLILWDNQTNGLSELMARAARTRRGASRECQGRCL